MFSGFFNSEWSLFSIPWKAPTAEDQNDDETLDPLIGKHICAIPICEEKEETYKMFTVGYDGKFMTHQFQFNPEKLEKLKSGNIFNIEATTQQPQTNKT